MVGILVSFWEGLFSGAMLVSGRVHLQLKLATNWNHRRLCWFQSIRTSLPPLLEWATAISSCLIWIDPSKVLPSLVLNWVPAILGIKNHYELSIFRMLCSKATKTKSAEFSAKWKTRLCHFFGNEKSLESSFGWSRNCYCWWKKSCTSW